MSRDNFLKELRHYTENYNYITEKNRYEKQIDHDIKSGLINPSKDNWDIAGHNLDVQQMQEITLTKGNPFEVLYDMDKDNIYRFLKILSNTHLGLIYFEKYSNPIRENKDKETLNKIFDVIDYIKEAYPNDNYKDTIEKLQGIAGGLQNKHYTKRQVYQDLLWNVHFFFFDMGLLADKINIVRIPSKISLDTVNAIIRDYFEDQQHNSFTRKTNLNTFHKYKYLYQTRAGIELIHSK